MTGTGAFRRGALSRVRATAAALLMSITFACAQDASTGWAPGQASRARLVSAGGLQPDGSYLIGVEIELSGKGLTYWRSPGEAGVPPVADFAGSANLARADLRFPVPERLEEGGVEAFGYRQHVLIPVRVQPRDPARPVGLQLDFHYASCDRICIPAEAKLALDLSPDAGVSDHVAVLAAALARVPVPSGIAGAPILKLTRTSGDLWEVRASPGVTGGDLFAEAPDGWYFETRAIDGGFSLRLLEKPAGQISTRLVLTLAGENAAWEHALNLDAGPLTP